MTTPRRKPKPKKPDPTRNARQNRWTAKQEAAALRDGFEGRSDALKQWGNGTAIMVRVEPPKE